MTAAGSQPKAETTVEDTVVQVRDQKGDWTDYARTTRAQALAAIAAGTLPGHTAPEPLRAVDWISKEEIAMTTKTTAQAETSAITAPEAAAKIGTDPKQFRRFLRSDASPIDAVGQGARYALDPKDLPKLKREFQKWQAEVEAKRAARAEAKAAEAADEDTDDEADEKPAPKPKSETKITKTEKTIADAKARLAAAHAEGRHPSGKVPSCPECEKPKTDS